MFKGQKKLSTGTNTRIPLCPVLALLLSKNYRSKWSTPKKKIKIECSILNMDSIDQPLDVLPKKENPIELYIYTEDMFRLLAMPGLLSQVLTSYLQSFVTFTSKYPFVHLSGRKSRQVRSWSCPKFPIPSIASFLRICALRLGGSLTTSASAHGDFRNPARNDPSHHW